MINACRGSVKTGVTSLIFLSVPFLFAAGPPQKKGQAQDGLQYQVTVKREGCVVSAQGGYYNPKTFAKSTKFEKELQLMDLAFNEHPQFQSPVDLPAAFLSCRDESGTRLVFLSAPPTDGLDDLFGPQAEMTCLLADQDGNVVETKPGNLRAPEVKKRRAFFYDLLPANPGTYDCAIVLRNTTTGKAARARRSMTVPLPESSGQRLDPPLLLVPKTDRNVVFLRAANKGGEAAEESSKDLRDLFPFLSNRLAPVLNEVGAETPKLLAILRSTVLGLPGERLGFTATLRPDGGGEDIPLDTSVFDRHTKGTTDVLLLEFLLPKPLPGGFTLTIVARDERSAAQAEVSRSLKTVRYNKIPGG
jgi:hypothetical protein